jgi:hypothetical protein
MPRTTSSMSTPARLASYKFVDQRLVDQRVELGPDAAGLAGAGIGDFRIDQAMMSLRICCGDMEMSSRPLGSI